jgi:hypothetical protein
MYIKKQILDAGFLMLDIEALLRLEFIWLRSTDYKKLLSFFPNCSSFNEVN